MNDQQSFLKPFSLQPAQAWTAILGLVFISIVCILAGLGKILNLLFPAGALGVGVFLYFRYPVLYLGFTWWLWFITPLVRRLADYRGGFTEPSPILLAPFLVTFITVITLWKNLFKTYNHGGLPFILAMSGCVYGFLVGLLNRPPIVVGIALLDWLAPVLLGFHLFANWRNYPIYRQNMQRTFLWGVLMMGIYGIFQYFVAPEWDRYWLINSGLSSAGFPVPFGIRVWSTLNAPRPFATVMMAGLLLLFSSKGIKMIIASVVGYLSFLLSLARTPWGSWFVGMLVLLASVRANIQMRLMTTFLVILLAVIPLTTIEPFSDVVSSRMETLTNLEDDGSASTRQETYGELLGSAVTNIVGEGIGGLTHDSAILSTLFNLGWFGTLFYIGGIIPLLFRLFQGFESYIDPFLGCVRAISFGIFAQVPLGVPMLEVQGVILWGFIGIGIAACKYHINQQIIKA